MASDYSTQALLTGALAVLEQDAPHLRFEIQPMGDNPGEALERGQIDLLLTIDYVISPDHPCQLLFEDDYVVVGDASQSRDAGRDDPREYFSLGQVTSRYGKSRVPAFDDWFMRRQKTQRRIDVVAPSFLSQIALVLGMRRIATVHRRLAQQMMLGGGLVLRELPFEIPPSARLSSGMFQTPMTTPCVGWLKGWPPLLVNSAMMRPTRWFR